MPRAFARRALLAVTMASGAACLPAAARAATITRDFQDPPGQGFNDATAAAPVGGNNGTTVGLQRRNAINRALDIWGARLQTTQVIRVVITFTGGNLPCTPTAAAVGAARADHHLIWTGPAGNPHPMTNVAYPAALFDRLAGQDASPGTPDVLAAFNARLGQADCGAGLAFYYGLDGQAPRDAADLLQVALHEFSHAVGFASLVNTDTGDFPTDGGVQRLDAFSTLVFDDVTQKRWGALTPAQRRTSVRANGRLLWDGPATTAAAARLDATPACRGAGNRMRLYAPTTAIPASSVSHWDTPCTPDLLMEPFTGAKPFLDLTPAALVDVGWTLVGACGDGARDEGEQCDAGADNGTARSSCAVTCVDSGHPTCGNGVVTGNEQCDDGAANGSPWSCCTGSCTLKKAGGTCRPAAGDCDIEETCNGTSVLCPPDALRVAGTVCRPMGGVCDVAEQCTGSSPECPADLVLVGGPPCRASTGMCDPPEFCDATSYGCPPDGLSLAGTPCDDGNVCTTNDTCQAGVCQPGPAFVCPSAGECYLPAACDSVARVCRAFPKADGTPCSGGACVQGTCTPIVMPPPELPAEAPAEPTPEPTPEPVVEAAAEPAPEASPEPAADAAAPDQPATVADAAADQPSESSNGEGGPVSPADAAASADQSTPASDAADAGAARDAGTAGDVPALPINARSNASGCGCALDDDPRSSSPGAGAALLLALLVLARRRHTRS